MITIEPLPEIEVPLYLGDRPVARILNKGELVGTVWKQDSGLVYVAWRSRMLSYEVMRATVEQIEGMKLDNLKAEDTIEQRS